MSTAYVIMTAMPPTKGHVNLVNFARYVADEYTVVLMTQPHEPMVYERYYALEDAFPDRVHHINRTLPQDPESEGFWDLWTRIMVNEVGVTSDDYIVSSEPYGMRLAEITGATFIPYDPERELTPVKATSVRNEPVENFDLIAPTFQIFLRKNITVFGAESTGKTTLARALARECNGHFFYEWARPYLEMVGPEITVESMTAIWKGQTALERHSDEFLDKPFAFFDTDLYSTIGYWELPHWRSTLGMPPRCLLEDAIPSDLYLITRSNIPFEEDPLRYGGDKREASDEYWIQVAKSYDLNYVVLESETLEDRIEESRVYIADLIRQMRSQISYDRGGF